MDEGFKVVTRQLKRRVRVFAEFRSFVLRGNALDLAVGVVMGAVFGAFVDSVVKNVLTPIISLPGRANFDRLSVCMKHRLDGTCSAPFGYGAVITSLITLLLTAASVYFFVVRPINKLRSRFYGPEPEQKSCPECLSKVPKGARKCAFCASPLPV